MCLCVSVYTRVCKCMCMCAYMCKSLCAHSHTCGKQCLPFKSRLRRSDEESGSPFQGMSDEDTLKNMLAALASEVDAFAAQAMYPPSKYLRTANAHIHTLHL